MHVRSSCQTYLNEIHTTKIAHYFTPHIYKKYVLKVAGLGCHVTKSMSFFYW